jgi:ATP-dependent DNA helicase DinG
VSSSEAFFGPGGLLARAHAAYEHRPGQLEMARAVTRTLETGGLLMIEAGTGTGKTLAYLVPALAAGRRVVISTGTRNLQDQIHDHDIPFLRERLGLRVSACVMKGRENYLCRFRLAELEREPLLEDLAEEPWIGRPRRGAARRRRATVPRSRRFPTGSSSGARSPRAPTPAAARTVRNTSRAG